MFRVLIIFAAVCVMAISGGSASACISMPMAPASYNPASESDVVFTGVAIKTKPTSRGYGVTVFNVTEKKKGMIIGKKVSVKHRTQQHFCDGPVIYKPNKDYTVHVKRTLFGRLYIFTPSYLKG